MLSLHKYKTESTLIYLYGYVQLKLANVQDNANTLVLIIYFSISCKSQNNLNHFLKRSNAMGSEIRAFPLLFHVPTRPQFI